MVFAYFDHPWGVKAGFLSLFEVVILYFAAPAVSQLSVNPGMTGPADRFQVADVMSSALRQRFYVVDSLCRSVSSYRKADLAERMLGTVGLSDGSPCFAVAFSGLGIALVLLVAPGLGFGVLFAEPSFGKLRASRERAWAFWSSWHCLLQIKKLQGINLRAWFCS